MTNQTNSGMSKQGTDGEFDSLRRTLAAVAVVGQIDGHDVIRRLSVLDLVDRAALAERTQQEARDPWRPFGLTLNTALERGDDPALLMDENSPLRDELRRLLARPSSAADCTAPGPDHKCGDAAIGVLQAIDRALHDSTAAEILDENSPIRDAMREVLKTVAGRYDCTAPMQPSDEQIIALWPQFKTTQFKKGEPHRIILDYLPFARAVLALATPAPTQAATGGEAYRVFKDGDQWCAVGPGFIDLQQSPAGFADTPGLALESLMKEFGKEWAEANGEWVKRARAAAPAAAVGEPWRDMAGDKLVACMFDEIESLRGAIRTVVQEQHKATSGMVALHIIDGKNDAVPVVDLMAVSLSVMMEAARESKWMPPEYVMNDWVADVCGWLRNGPPVAAGWAAAVQPMSEAEIAERGRIFSVGYRAGQEDRAAAVGPIPNDHCAKCGEPMYWQVAHRCNHAAAAPEGLTEDQILDGVATVLNDYEAEKIGLHGVYESIIALRASAKTAADYAHVPEGGWFIPHSAFNEPMFRTFDKMLAHAQRARWVNVVVRKDGVETTYEADWIKHMNPLEPSQNPSAKTAEASGDAKDVK